MTGRLRNKEIIEIYRKTTNYGFFFRLFFIMLLLLFSLYNIYRLLTFGEASAVGDIFVNLIKIPIIIIIGIGLIKHVSAVYSDERLMPILWNPFLSTRCVLSAIRPSEEDKNKFRYISILYYASVCLLIITIISIIIFFTTIILYTIMK